MLGNSSSGREWISGRLARKKASESPGRVAHSAKSWLCHHAVDRNVHLSCHGDRTKSPSRRESRPSRRLRCSSNTCAGPGTRDLLLKRPFPRSGNHNDRSRILRRSGPADSPWMPPASRLSGARPTSRRSLKPLSTAGSSSMPRRRSFELPKSPRSSRPRHRHRRRNLRFQPLRDNRPVRLIASAHKARRRQRSPAARRRQYRPRDRPPHRTATRQVEELSVVQWNFLVARCRDLKERCLATATGEDFAVSIPSQGSSLLGRTLTARIRRAEVESIVLEGFFPRCARKRPPFPRRRRRSGNGRCPMPPTARSHATWPTFYAAGPAIDAILFNGGSLHPEVAAPSAPAADRQMAR